MLRALTWIRWYIITPKGIVVVPWYPWNMWDASTMLITLITAIKTILKKLQKLPIWSFEQNNYNHVKTLYRHYFIHIIDTSNRIRLYNGSKTCIFSKSFTTDKHFVSTFILRKWHYSQKHTMLQICGVAFAAGIVSMILFSNECMLPCNHKDDIGWC